MFDGEQGAGGAAVVEAPAEQSIEQQLEALLPEKKTASPEADAGEGAQPKPAEGQQPDASQEAAPTDPILEKLDKIEDKTEEQPKNELTTEQRQILDAAPQLIEIAQGYQTFTNTFASGDFDSMEKMLEGFNPAAYQAFLDHIYTKRVASGEWVDRYIAEKEGNGQVDKSVRGLQQQIAQLQSQLQERHGRDQQNAEAARNQAVVNNYVNHIEGLFNQLEFNEGDRRWVWADINAAVASDPRVKNAILSGNTAAVNSIFKKAVREYVTRDQANSKVQAVKAADQAKHKPPVQGSPVVTEGALPSDVNQVPKDKLDDWMDQELRKLKSGRK